MTTGTAGIPPNRGKRFGRYRLLEVIGRGGMAEVYRAVAQGPGGFQRQVVLKRIRAEKTESNDFVDMFFNEARISAMLEHPNIVQVYDFGEVNGDYYLAMEYLRGKDLLTVMRNLRASQRELPIGVAAFAVNEVARGLAYAHGLSQGGKSLDIIHRDVTPSNIMLLKTGGVKLLDFGIARAAMKLRSTTPASGLIKGKFAYLSPEQVRGKSVDARADIFSLGVVFWECLVGQRLFWDNNDMQTMRNILEKDVPPPSLVRPGLPPALDDLVLRALDRDPQRRLPSAAAFVEALSGYLTTTQFSSDSVARLLEDSFGAGSWNEDPLPEMAMTPIPDPPHPPATLVAKKRSGRFTAEHAEVDSGYSVVSSVRPLPKAGPKSLYRAGPFALAGALALGSLVLVFRGDQSHQGNLPTATLGALPGGVAAPKAVDPVAPQAQTVAAPQLPAVMQEEPETDASLAAAASTVQTKPARLPAIRTQVAKGNKPSSGTKLQPHPLVVATVSPQDLQAARDARSRGLQALESGQVQQARIVLQAALVALPGDTQILNGLAEAAFEMGDFKGAHSFAKRAVASAPGSAKNQVLLGDVCFKMGMMADAVQAYNAASSLAPNDEAIRSRLARAQNKL